MADRARRRWPALELTHRLSLDPVADVLLTALDGLDVSGIEERAPGTWLVYFASVQARDRAVARVAGTLAAVAVAIRPIDVPDAAWAARSQASLKATRVGRLTIAPPWDVSARTPARDIIVIEPSTGFGTGHHATTRLCLLALQDSTVAGRSVLDLGTGSGVLALAACRLGAAAVTGVDVDPDALAAAQLNLDRDPDGRLVKLVLGDVRLLSDLRADLVVANLTSAVLTSSASRLLALVQPAGVVIVSGFTTDQASRVQEAFGDAARIAASYTEDGWTALRVAVESIGSEIAPQELQHGYGGE